MRAPWWLPLVLSSVLVACLGDLPRRGILSDAADGASGTDGASGAETDTASPCGPCDDGNPCTIDTCDVATGVCLHADMPDGVECACHSVCEAGHCQYPPGLVGCSGPKDCSDGDPCTTDTCVDECDCVNTPIPGCPATCPKTCDDGDPCTLDDCDPATGACTHAPIAGCPWTCPPSCDDGNPCTVDECDATTGSCTHAAVPDGTSCGPCGTTCVAGTCPPVVGFAGCTEDADCGDGDPCTIDTCSETCHCVHVPIEGCGGSCPESCDDGNPCTLDICEEGMGECAHTPAPNGTPCGPCGAACSAGWCAGPPVVPSCAADEDCEDGDPCTADYCYEECYCAHEVLPDPECWIEPCLDGECDDDNPCTDDACAADGICTHKPAPDGTSCGACGAFCAGGSCQGVWGGCMHDTDCHDGDPCTEDICTEACFCMFEPVYSPACETPECVDWMCEDGDPCTVDTCAPGGSCLHATVSPCIGTTCSSEGAVSVMDVKYDPWTYETAKIAGVVGAGAVGGCSDMDCPADAPCCNGCDFELVLEEGYYALPLSGMSTSWYCSGDECGGNLYCSPMHAGVAYWAWGKTLSPYLYGAAPPPLPPLPEVDGLEVHGWCLQTTPAGLPGTYAGTLMLDSLALGTTDTHQVILTIAHGPTGWSATLDATPDASCTACLPIPSQDLADFTVGDGWISFSLEAGSTDTGMILPALTIQLGSWQNHLVGAFDAPWWIAIMPKPPASGVMDVVRQP